MADCANCPSVTRTSPQGEVDYLCPHCRWESDNSGRFVKDDHVVTFTIDSQGEIKPWVLCREEEEDARRACRGFGGCIVRAEMAENPDPMGCYTGNPHDRGDWDMSGELPIHWYYHVSTDYNGETDITFEWRIAPD